MEKNFKVNNFDLIRILAAIQVLVLHSIYHLNITDSAWFAPWSFFPGVPIFYALSGYLISASYERSTSLKQYFRNRALRIFPGLWACLLLTVLVTSLLGFNYINKSAPIWLISQMFGFIYTPYFLADFGFGSYNGSLWTISVELQFYMMLPLVYLLMGKRKQSNNILLLVFLLFLAFTLATKLWLPGMATDHETKFEKLLRYSFLPHFYLFLAGVIMQRFQFYKSEWIHGKGLYWIIGYIAVQSFVATSDIPALSVFSLLLLTVCAISLAYTGDGLAHKVLKGNDISYGVYIYHGLILSLLVYLKYMQSPVYLGVVLVGALVLGYLSWIFVEKPFMLKKKQTIHQQTQSDPMVATIADVKISAGN
ncbi:MAG: acyltransferase [Dyadobacter sp.]|uniref:acyltransferase family protein n=1 Tax=Dyadobacter sp. TaxID=1914288 RepID=UPI003264E963